MKEASATSNATGRHAKYRRLLRTMGVGGFLFFLVKGLIWLAVFFGLTAVTGN